MHKITFLLCENMLATSATLPFEMLRAAESAARAKEGSQVEPVLIQTT